MKYFSSKISRRETTDAFGAQLGMASKTSPVAIGILLLLLLVCGAGGAKQEPFRRDPGHPQWHHGNFQDFNSSVKQNAHNLLHSRAEVPFRVPLEINLVMLGFNGDGGYRYKLDFKMLEEVLQKSMPSHRPACLETGQPLDIEHELIYKVIPVAQPELVAVEWAVRRLMQEAGKARETEYGREIPLFEVEATLLERTLDQLYLYLFGVDANSDVSVNQPVPTAIFVLNLDKKRIDPRIQVNHTLEEAVMGRISELSAVELREQERDYLYRYRYNGGSSTQVWLAAGRYAVIDLSAGPCTYGRVDSEEGSVGYRSLPRLRNLLFPRGQDPVPATKTQHLLAGQISGLVSSAIEQVIAPDVRFETVDVTYRLLVPVIVLQNHHVRNPIDSPSNFGINMVHIQNQVKKLVQPGQDPVVVGGVHSLHDHPRLAIAVSKATRGVSVHETGRDARIRARTRTYLDGAILRDEMMHSADVLAAGLLEVADPALAIQYFRFHNTYDNKTGEVESVIKSSPAGFKTDSRLAEKGTQSVRRGPEKRSTVQRAYGTRVVPVFVLSLAGVDDDLLLDGESLWWASHDSVFVLQHGSEQVSLSYVSETKRRVALPQHADRHIIAGLASVVGGVVAPYEKASHIHGRPVVNWLWASGHHPFGPFSNTSSVSRLLLDTALRNAIYARVDMSLRGIRRATEMVQTFVGEFLRTPIGKPVKGRAKRNSGQVWLDMFYKKTTNLPEPVPHELVERVEKYLDSLEEKLVDLSSLLYYHQLDDAHSNSSNILQTVMRTEVYVDRVLEAERDRMRCCNVEYNAPVQHSQALLYGGILIAGFLIYFLVICFSSSER